MCGYRHGTLCRQLWCYFYSLLMNFIHTVYNSLTANKDTGSLYVTAPCLSLVYLSHKFMHRHGWIPWSCQRHSLGWERASLAVVDGGFASAAHEQPKSPQQQNISVPVQKRELTFCVSLLPPPRAHSQTWLFGGRFRPSYKNLSPIRCFSGICELMELYLADIFAVLSQRACTC